MFVHPITVSVYSLSNPQWIQTHYYLISINLAANLSVWCFKNVINKIGLVIPTSEAKQTEPSPLASTNTHELCTNWISRLHPSNSTISLRSFVLFAADQRWSCHVILEGKWLGYPVAGAVFCNWVMLRLFLLHVPSTNRVLGLLARGPH